jgi:hypothetical protein
LAYNAPMLRTQNTAPLHFTPLRHAVVWLFLAAVFLSLAGGAYYWNEAAQYHTYLWIALVLVVFAIAPLVVSVFQSKAK